MQPRSRRSEVVGLHGARLKVRIAAPATEGRANAELIRMIADLTGVPRREVAIVRGGSNRDKDLSLPGTACIAALKP